MSHRVAGAPLDFAALRAKLEVPGDFASEVLTDAAEAAHAASWIDSPVDDATDIAFVTIDPAGSRDLDQAVHIARVADGYLVSYAIADVASFVRPGSALDAETHRRATRSTGKPTAAARRSTFPTCACRFIRPR